LIAHGREVVIEFPMPTLDAHPAPDLVARLLAHPLYGEVRDEPALRLFLRSHVFCVWDFQCLLKALQRAVTCVQVPWLPTSDPEARRLINEIVLDEESDIAPGGGHLSHFELYREAMRAAGADGAPIDALLADVARGTDVERALQSPALPPAAARFTLTTLRLAAGPTHRAAAAFAWGREEIIPDMFRRLVGALAQRQPGRWELLRYYLERHIERDAEVHSVAARALARRLCGDDVCRHDEARAAAREALEARLLLWDALFDEIRAARASEMPLATMPSSAQDRGD
jgi:Protein of unknown function (DUF3050)